MTKVICLGLFVMLGANVTLASLREGGGICAILDELYFRINQQMTEGERGTVGLTKCYFFEKYYYAGSFHHFVVPLPPGGRLS